MGDDLKLIKTGKLSECPYGKGNLRRMFIITTGKPPKNLPDMVKQSESLYSTFLPKGLMAASHSVYGNDCIACRSCVPLRIAARNYPFSASERKILRVNADLVLSARDTNLNTEHYNLFKKYRDERHSATSLKDWQRSDFFDNIRFHSGAIETRTRAGSLLAVTIYDALENGINLYSTFFDPRESAKRSLGTFCILTAVRAAQDIGTDHIYLGSWVRNSNTVDYKKRFKNLETYSRGHWVPFDPQIHMAGPDDREAIPQGLAP